MEENKGVVVTLNLYELTVAAMDLFADFERAHSTEAIYEMLFGTQQAERYRAEKLGKLKTGGMLHLWGGLDSKKRETLVAAVVAHKEITSCP